MKFKSCDQVFNVAQFGTSEIELTVQLDNNKATFIVYLRVDKKLRLNSKFEIIYPQDPVTPDSVKDACALKVGHIDGTVSRAATGDFGDTDYIDAIKTYMACLSTITVIASNAKTMNKLRQFRYSLNKALEYIVNLLGENFNA